MISASSTLNLNQAQHPSFDVDTMRAIEQQMTAGNPLSDYHAWLSASFVQRKGIEVMKSVVGELKKGKNFDLAIVLRLISDLVTSCKNNEDHFVTLARLKDTANYTYSHPVNVCIYSIAMGAKLQYNDKQILRLGIAALLHDIGEVKLPERMLSKAAKFTEAEISAMQRHPELGYELLRRDKSIPEDVLLGVLHHHERLDGSGYPSGHVGRFIHPLGKIIAVAETFDAMTSTRVSAEGGTTTDALKMLYSLAGKHYESNVIKALITLLGMYPIGSLVRLSGGQQAVVFKKNKANLNKPKIIVITDVNNQPVEPYLVDLYGDTRDIMYAENVSASNLDTNKTIQEFLLKNESLS